MKVNKSQFKELKFDGVNAEQAQIKPNNKLSQMLSGDGAFGHLDGVEISGNKTVGDDPKTKKDKRFEELKRLSKDEVKSLRRDTQKLIAKYMQEHEIKDANGETIYDLSEISKLIGHCAGNDCVDSQAKEGYCSEVEHIKRELAQLFGKEVSDISDKQVKDLVKFCGYEWSIDRPKVNNDNDDEVISQTDSLSSEVKEEHSITITKEVVKKKAVKDMKEGYDYERWVYAYYGMTKIPLKDAVEILYPGLTEKYPPKALMEKFAGPFNGYDRRGVVISELINSNPDEMIEGCARNPKWVEDVEKYIEKYMSEQKEKLHHEYRKLSDPGSPLSASEIGPQKPKEK